MSTACSVFLSFGPFPCPSRIVKFQRHRWRSASSVRHTYKIYCQALWAWGTNLQIWKALSSPFASPIPKIIESHFLAIHICWCMITYYICLYINNPSFLSQRIPLAFNKIYDKFIRWKTQPKEKRECKCGCYDWPTHLIINLLAVRAIMLIGEGEVYQWTEKR